MSLIGSDDHFAILFAFDHVGTTCLLNRPNLANLPAVVGLNRVMLYQVPRTATVIGHGPVRIGHGPVRAVPEIDFELTIAFSCIKKSKFLIIIPLAVGIIGIATIIQNLHETAIKSFDAVPMLVIERQFECSLAWKCHFS